MSDLELNKALGQHIKAARVRAGLTQEGLALRCGLSRASVTNIENGVQGIALDALYRVARAVNCEPADLLPALALVALSASSAVELSVDANLAHESRQLRESVKALARRSSK